MQGSLAEGEGSVQLISMH